MCGIVGLIDRKTSCDALIERIQRAVERLNHRGPDDNGIYINKDTGVFLGNTRLSIIEPSFDAHQPMVSQCNKYIIVFNGEIYNYKELFSLHCPQDGTINGRSDTAVLLYLFSRFGSNCLEMINGMFAFAIVDIRDGSTFLARDRFGEKPLYWINKSQKFAFSSELKGLHTLMPELGWNIDSKALALYHTIGSIPPPITIYKEVNALMPGCWLLLKSDGSCINGKYWTLDNEISNIDDHQITDYSDTVDKTYQHLSQAVSSRMVSDVPVGVFLSGGYDSSSILGLCAHIDIMPKTTLCIDFEDRHLSEFNKAKEIANLYGVSISRHILDESLFMRELPNYFYSMDQPTINGYNTYFVSKVARETGIKVWLSGVGGDELFGGYPSFYRIFRLRWLSSMMQKFHLTGLVDNIAPLLQERLRYSRLLHLSDNGNTSIRAYQCCRNLIPWRNVKEILAQDIWEDIGEFHNVLDEVYSQTCVKGDNFQKASMLETLIYMRSQLLRDMDNFSMAHSIELRAPFLDHKLYSFVLNLPADFKQFENRFKPLLGDTMATILPKKMLDQKKRGFTFPMETWILNNVKNSFEEIVFNPYNERFWNLKKIKQMWGGFKKNKVHWGVMWNIYAFARWHENLK